MFKEYEQEKKTKPVAVTEHLIKDVANSNPTLFIKEGNILIDRVLYYLGFRINNDIITEGLDRDQYYNLKDYSYKDKSCYKRF